MSEEEIDKIIERFEETSWRVETDNSKEAWKEYVEASDDLARVQDLEEY